MFDLWLATVVDEGEVFHKIGDYRTPQGALAAAVSEGPGNYRVGDPWGGQLEVQVTPDGYIREGALHGL